MSENPALYTWAQLSELSFACPHCGDWLPMQAAYDKFRGFMRQEHICLCGRTTTIDDALYARLKKN
jgi:hypothetical protein